MSDKFKGIIITFDKEVHEERIEEYKKIFLSIRNVQDATPLVKNAEDHMSELKGRNSFRNEILNFIVDTTEKDYNLKIR